MWNLDEDFSNLTGIQAIILGSLLQRERDEKNNYKTSLLFCGYRGSPLGALDKEILSIEKNLNNKKIYFHPGLNEELACAVIFGTQNYKLFGPPEDWCEDGVTGIWYGKGPGVDRSGDHIHHYNFAGTSKKGGAVLLCGDDHNAKSSSLPHETTLTLVSWFVPVLAPSSVQEIPEFFIHAVELSRYSGCWIALKIISDIADAYETIDIRKLRNIKVNIPSKNYDVSIRWPDTGIEQEKRMYTQKLPAVQEYLKLNSINKIIKNNGNNRGVIVVGKTFHNLMRLYDYNVEKMNFDLLKIGCIWPIDHDVIKKFIHGKKEILIIEEKFGVFEKFFKDALFEIMDEDSIRELKIYGKEIVSPLLDISTKDIAKYLRKTLFEEGILEKISKNSAVIPDLKRTPFYCGGCPHNTSTKLLKGDIAVLGIGCHYLASMMKDRPTITICPMGGEGVSWISASKFSKRKHIFVNLGDGTYFHSGILAIRAAVAAKVKITYKILYNQAVAMTGGQPLDGELSLLDLTKQLLAEKVDKVYIVSHYYKEKSWFDFPTKVDIRPKEDFEEVMKEAKEKVDGVSVIIYDQMCATEKRRKQKRGLIEKENYRIFINEDVCDACGDCQVKSNCLAIEVKKTITGYKRQIDQTACNLDTSCLKGYCPSFVIQYNAKNTDKLDLPTSNVMYEKGKLTKPFDIITVGVGGTGISTLTKIISDAALLDGYKVKAMDQTGLAQRYGEVTGIVTIFNKNEEQYISDSKFNLMIGCDLYSSYSKYISYDIEKYVMNSGFYNLPQVVYGEYVNDKIKEIEDFFVKENRGIVLNFMEIAKRYGIKDRINILMLGASLKELPLSEDSVVKSIKNNFPRKFAEENVKILKFGKYIRENPNEFIFENKETYMNIFSDFQKLLSHQEKEKTKIFALSQNKISGFYEKEMEIRLTKSLFDLLYVKDEIEVARLWVEYFNNNFVKDGHKSKSFGDIIKNLFNVKIGIVMPYNRKSGKKTFLNGLIAYPLFYALSKMKFVRKYLHLLDKHLIDKKYREKVLEKLLYELNSRNIEELKNLVSKIEKIRGYGKVRIENIKKYFPEILNNQEENKK